MSAFGQTGTRSPAPSAAPVSEPSSTEQATGNGTEQGQEQTQTQDGFWGRFPTVPEDQREALEPHLKSVQAYVTRLEQTYKAPFQGYTPQQVQGLAKFAQAFDSNPLGSFVAIAADLQKRGVIHEDLDIRALAAVIQGQEPPDDEEVAPVAPVATQTEGNDPWADAPPWAQEMRSWRQEQEQQQQEQQRAQQEQREDAVLNSQVTSIKATLKAENWPKEYLENPDLEKDLIARFIVHGGSRERKE
jgi:hypothetical protein